MYTVRSEPKIYIIKNFFCTLVTLNVASLCGYIQSQPSVPSKPKRVHKHLSLRTERVLLLTCRWRCPEAIRLLEGERGRLPNVLSMSPRRWCAPQHVSVSPCPLSGPCIIGVLPCTTTFSLVGREDLLQPTANYNTYFHKWHVFNIKPFFILERIDLKVLVNWRENSSSRVKTMQREVFKYL